MDVREQVDFTDYFIICTGTSDRMLQSLSDAVKNEIREKISSSLHCARHRRRGWMLLDIGDIVVHIFSPDRRNYYSLEELWNESKILLSYNNSYFHYIIFQYFKKSLSLTLRKEISYLLVIYDIKEEYIAIIHLYINTYFLGGKNVKGESRLNYGLQLMLALASDPNNTSKSYGGNFGKSFHSLPFLHQMLIHFSKMV
jgi:ribosome-associated protein